MTCLISSLNLFWHFSLSNCTCWWHTSHELTNYVVVDLSSLLSYSVCMPAALNCCSTICTYIQDTIYFAHDLMAFNTNTSMHDFRPISELMLSGCGGPASPQCSQIIERVGQNCFQWNPLMIFKDISSRDTQQYVALVCVPENMTK